MECRAHTLIAAVTLLAEGRVLLVKYKNMPDQQRGWFLPDDGLLDLEHPGDAAKRILKSQLNLSVPELHLSHIESFKGMDRSWHLIFHYRVELDKAMLLAPSENVESMEWFALGQLPARSEIAHHGWAIDVINEIMGKRTP